MLKRLLYMNGLAILAVVLNHARVWGVVAMVFWADRYKPVTVPDYSQVGSAEYYSLLVLDGIIQFAIPTFLFVSGFLRWRSETNTIQCNHSKYTTKTQTEDTI